MSIESIVLGGGCFWCFEAIFQKVKGVTNVESGYTGGQSVNPTYEQVCSGQSGHAEVVRIEFDNEVTNLSNILEVFWRGHDPTTLNRQGNDSGTQYRSCIFWTDKSQVDIIHQSITDVAKVYHKDLITTTIEPLGVFYKGEGYHQNYFNSNQMNPYCFMVIRPKLNKLGELLEK
jgi:peptide-methionine (S)-S-oxide reductase